MGRLSGYSNRIKITTKSTKVDSDLIDFPLGLTLSSGCGIYSQDMTAIFDEVGNDYTKIAITSYDGETILPTEVEYWNEEVKEAQLWFKAPNVYSAADTDFYLYYDATSSGNALIDTNEDAITFQSVVAPGSEGTYDTVHALSPYVLKENEVYKMWYSGNNGSNWRIIYCTSVDGINWSNFQMVVDKGSEGTYDTVTAHLPCVLKDGDTYKMWYSGYSSNHSVIYCTSVDGINWSNFQMVASKGSEGTYDINGAHAPRVIKDGSIYKMWYTGLASDGATWRILYCTSVDGINWSNFQMVVDKGSEGVYDSAWATTSIVLKEDGIYKMWYAGLNGVNYRIIYCTSADGINWSNFQMVVDKGSEGVYDSSYSEFPFVFKDGVFYKMWYTGHNGTNRRIIYTSSQTPEWKTATQSVWDSSYKAVYHMNNDPSGGAGCIKDSTSNKYHGTPGGSMTSDDLINGRAIEFDGADDWIDCGNIISLCDKDLVATISFAAVGVGMCISNERSSNTLGGAYITLPSSFLLQYGIHNLSSPPYTENIFSTNYRSSSLMTYHAVAANGGANEYRLFVEDNYDIISKDFVSGASTSYTNIEIGRWRNYTYSNGMFSGAIGEVRISSSVRSVSWTKVENYSSSDSLLYFTEDQIPYDYIFRGIIKEKGMPVQRRVCAYRRSTNLLAGSTTSSVDGYYYITTPYNEEHYIVVLDNDSGDDYNALIQDRVYPSLT